MTAQRIRVTIDAVTVQGGTLSRPALERAIADALAGALAGRSGPIAPAPQALERSLARARPAPRDTGPEAAIGRAVATAAKGVLGP